MNKQTTSILNPVFLEIREYATDPFWKKIFTDLATGNTSFGLHITTKTICCSDPKKKFRYVLNKSPKTMFKNIQHLLIDKIGLQSTHEKKIHLENEKIDVTHLEWSKIRKRNVRNMLLEDYVLLLKKQYDLTIEKTRHVLNLLHTGLFFKWITSKDIIFKPNSYHIKTIETIRYNPNTCSFAYAGKTDPLC